MDRKLRAQQLWGFWQELLGMDAPSLTDTQATNLEKLNHLPNLEKMLIALGGTQDPVEDSLNQQPLPKWHENARSLAGFLPSIERWYHDHLYDVSAAAAVQTDKALPSNTNMETSTCTQTDKAQAHLSSLNLKTDETETALTGRFSPDFVAWLNSVDGKKREKHSVAPTKGEQMPFRGSGRICFSFCMYVCMYVNIEVCILSNFALLLVLVHVPGAVLSDACGCKFGTCSWRVWRAISFIFFHDISR